MNLAQITGSVRNTVLLCLVFISIVLGMFYYSMTRTPTLTTEQLQQQGVLTLPRPRDIAPFSLSNAAGGGFSNENLQGRWSFLFFGFTNCPDICPTSMSVMAQAEQQLIQADPELAEQFQGILVSVDPERDTPELVSQYAHAFSKNFTGVVGSREDLASLAAQLNATFAKVPDEGGGYQIDHTGNIVVINPKGHYHGFIKQPHKADTVKQAFVSYALNF